MTPPRSSSCSIPLALALAATTGCEIEMTLGELDDTSTTAAAGDGTEASSSATSSASNTSGVAEDTSSGVAEDTSGVAEDTSSDTDETAGAVCNPPPEDFWINVILNDEPVERDPYYRFVDADCVVQGVVEDGIYRIYTFECDEGGIPVPHELQAGSSAGPLELPLTAGTPVHLQLFKDYPIDFGGLPYVMVRDAAGDLVLGYYGGGSVPAEVGNVDAWFAPLAFELAFGDCEPEPFEEPGTMFIIDPCPAVRTRLAVDFQLGDEGIHLLDHTSGQLGPLSLFVASARHLDPVGEDTCGFAPDGFSFVAYREK
jgi:hypothetical protein